MELCRPKIIDKHYNPSRDHPSSLGEWLASCPRWVSWAKITKSSKNWTAIAAHLCLLHLPSSFGIKIIQRYMNIALTVTPRTTSAEWRSSTRWWWISWEHKYQGRATRLHMAWHKASFDWQKWSRVRHWISCVSAANCEASDNNTIRFLHDKMAGKVILHKGP